MNASPDIHSVGLRIENGRVLVLDQTLLPHQEIWLESTSPQVMAEMIHVLRVRGAPLIGVAAAAELGRFASTGVSKSEWLEAAHLLRRARPTAVNLMAAVDRMISVAGKSSNWNPEALAGEAFRIFSEDQELCVKIGGHGACLIQDGDSVLTHCNAGALATAGIGTAVGVIATAWNQGKKIHVYVDETRPLFQGARLTAWELGKLGIPHTLICDNMAASLMASGKVQKIFVGADRIAANGDFANKIGTYGVALAADYHKVPFYCAAPYTTVDLACASGNQIPIEVRNPAEVRLTYAPSETAVWNPAFDVTPGTLVSGFVTDRGVFQNHDLASNL